MLRQFSLKGTIYLFWIHQALTCLLNRGNSSKTVVTDYLILDDSTHVKRYAKKMSGLGWHYSSTDQRSMPGHSLFEGVYVVEGHQYPLSPQMYRQKSVCEREGVPFQNKVDLAEKVIREFEPLTDSYPFYRQL